MLLMNVPANIFNLFFTNMDIFITIVVVTTALFKMESDFRHVLSTFDHNHNLYITLTKVLWLPQTE